MSNAKSPDARTILAHDGRPDEGPVNRPIQRGSTVAFRSLAAFEAGAHRPSTQSRTHTAAATSI